MRPSKGAKQRDAAKDAAKDAKAEKEAAKAKARWFERLDNEDRAAVEAAVGYAAPEIPEKAERLNVNFKDLAELRGKVVVLYFWSSTNKGSIGALDALKQIASDYRKKGLEVVTVSYDKAEDREKLAAAIKENRISWPVHFDGKGAKAEFAAKLNITGVPALLVFDQKGMLLHTMQGTNLTVNLPVNQLDGQVRRMFGIK